MDLCAKIPERRPGSLKALVPGDPPAVHMSSRVRVLNPVSAFEKMRDLENFLPYQPCLLK